VRNRVGAALASISVSAQSVRMTPAQIVAQALPVIRAAAAELEELL
jgi:DNA-binding IclR family transcriptional regulator